MSNSRGHFYSADERYLAAFGHFILNFLNLEGFYGTVTKSLDVAKPQTEKEWLEGAQKSMASPQMERFKQKNPRVGGEDFVKKLSMGMASRSLRLAKQTVDSAALVFAHTLLDGALSECCHISFLADPATWGTFVEGRKVDLGRLKTKTVKDVTEEIAREHVLQLEREPMTKRLEVINRLCVPRLHGAEIPTAWLKHEALHDFDRLRQRIIHGQPFLRRKVDVEDQLYFAKSAGFAVLALVAQAYGLLNDAAIEPKSYRAMLRLCAVVKREFPEFIDLFQDFLGASQTSPK